MAKYDEIVSLGSNCCPGLSLRILNKKKETYPFDWVRSNSKIIYDVLNDSGDKYTTFNQNNISSEYYVKNIHLYTHPKFVNSHINFYGQHFTHYTNITTHELIIKFKRFLQRFFELLNSNKHVLFLHSNEEFIYHKKSRDNKAELYEYLCKINDIIEVKYPNLTFDIVNIDVNNNFKDYKNIKNINIDYALSFSDKCETHTHEYYTLYRKLITDTIQTFIQNKTI